MLNLGKDFIVRYRLIKDKMKMKNNPKTQIIKNRDHFYLQ